MTRFCRATAPAALSNVLGLVVLKAWAPAVPDFYQGTELVEPALTDPDNRRPVDFAARACLLASLPEPSPAASRLLSSWPDGRSSSSDPGAAARAASPTRALRIGFL